jgi:hypothetical protein
MTLRRISRERFRSSRLTSLVRSRAVVLRAGVAGILICGVAPASAALLVQNYMQADVARSEACLKSVAGTNATAFGSGVPSIAVSSGSFTTAEGTPLIRQIITVRGVKPERTVLADAFRLRNRCGHPVSVTITAAAHGSSAAVAGEWNDLSLRIHLSNTQTAAPATDLLPPLTPAATIAAGNTFTDPTVVAAWNQTPLRIGASTGGVGTVLSGASGPVIIANNSDIQVAVVVDAGSNAIATDATLRTVVAAHGPNSIGAFNAQPDDRAKPGESDPGGLASIAAADSRPVESVAPTVGTAVPDTAVSEPIPVDTTVGRGGPGGTTVPEVEHDGPEDTTVQSSTTTTVQTTTTTTPVEASTTTTIKTTTVETTTTSAASTTSTTSVVGAPADDASTTTAPSTLPAADAPAAGPVWP